MGMSHAQITVPIQTDTVFVRGLVCRSEGLRVRALYQYPSTPQHKDWSQHLSTSTSTSSGAKKNSAHQNPSAPYYSPQISPKIHHDTNHVMSFSGMPGVSLVAKLPWNPHVFEISILKSRQSHQSLVSHHHLICLDWSDRTLAIESW